jgi:catechol 2,3-dioxygenase-like lactoylglutathione lyase family enzyme
MPDVVSPVPAPAPGARSPGISRAIYGMPMFATLHTTDLDRTVSWFVDGLGFVVLFRMPPLPSPTMLVHLRRWQFQDILIRPTGSPVTAGSTSTLNFAAVYDEIDELAARARAHGGGAVEGPMDTPWNTRDVTTTDPDGNVVVFTAGRPPDRTDPEFTATMLRWNVEQG